MRLTFKKGIHLPHNKLTRLDEIAVCDAPSIVAIPLSQHIGKPAVCTVNVGDRVKAGTRIGVADGVVSADVFSSVSGVVKSIENHKTVTGKALHVFIENDGEYEEEKLELPDKLTVDDIRDLLRRAGIVGMGGAGFPSAVKYSPKKPIDTFILNAAECEPYITCDDRLIIERTVEILRGGELLSRVLGIPQFHIGIEDNKPEAIAALERAISGEKINAVVDVLKSKYPQGAEKQLIYAVTKRKVPVGGLPSDVGVVVGNVHTAYSLYDAATSGTPLYARAMTVTGGVFAPKNLWVRNGTPFGYLAEKCGVDASVVRTVCGGPMMGFALPDLDYYTTKMMDALLFLNDDAVNTDKSSPCINCAKCARACPMNLMPMYIDAYTQIRDYATAEKYGAKNCIECGCCAYVCPAKRPIVQSVRLCKKMLRGGK
ncbi:MAG: electron transport complex subunit RsxC [Clostridiales bacterium]|nr:electron transport complex subunit RsxC [Clostridiales bacterium]